MPGVPGHTSGASQACSLSKVRAELRGLAVPARPPAPPARPPHRPKHAPRHLRTSHLKLSQQGTCTAVFTGLFFQNLLILAGQNRQTDHWFSQLFPQRLRRLRGLPGSHRQRRRLPSGPLPAHSGSCCQPSAGFACKAVDLSCACRLSTSVQGSARPGPPHPPHLQQALCPAAILRDTAPACTACFCEQPWEAASLGPMWTQHPGQ